jgi:hypothetical protein
MSSLGVVERMPRCFPLSIISSLWQVPEKSMALLLLITSTDGVPIHASSLLITRDCNRKWLEVYYLVSLTISRF